MFSTKAIVVLHRRRVFIAIFVAAVVVALSFSYFIPDHIGIVVALSLSRLKSFTFICRCPFYFWLLFLLLVYIRFLGTFDPLFSLMSCVYVYDSYLRVLLYTLLFDIFRLTCFKYFPIFDILFLISVHLMAYRITDFLSEFFPMFRHIIFMYFMLFLVISKLCVCVTLPLFISIHICSLHCLSSLPICKMVDAGACPLLIWPSLFDCLTK